MIRILIVDDSPLMRRLLDGVFRTAGDFEIAQARDGADALRQLHTFEPDVITLDVQMPGLDGLACLDRIMVERPTPVIMVSAMTAEGAAETLEAIALGAVDFIAKPTRAISLAIEDLAETLVDKARAASRAQLRRSHRLTERVRARLGRHLERMPAPEAARPSPIEAPDEPVGCVLVGASTGGPPAIEALLTRLPANFPWPVVVAQHMPASFTLPLARRLDDLSALSIHEVTRPMPLAPGHIYIGRGDADVVISRRPSGLIVQSIPASPEFRWHPSVDRLVDSAIEHLGAKHLVGVLMTGMGTDGAAAMARMHEGGGRTIAESEDSAVIWGMPGALVKAGGAGIVVPLEEIAPRLLDLAGLS